MKRIPSRVVLPFATGVIAIVWIVAGVVRYGWWLDGRPQSGFFPIIVGALMLLVSVLAVVNETKVSQPVFLRTHVLPVMAAIGMVLLALLIGFFPALVVYVFGWLRWFERYSLKLSGLTTVLTTAAVYGIFRLWLRVPFPTGWLFNLL
jgi:hypothetical protein